MNHYDHIFNNVYLGDAGFMYETNRPQFSLIINCCPEVSMRYTDAEAPNVLYLKFNDDPQDNNKMLTLLESYKVLEKIHETASQGKPVLVHCAMGMQRSASIVACYLLKYYKADLKTTLLFIQDKRHQAFSTGYPFLPVMQYYVELRKNLAII